MEQIRGLVAADADTWLVEPSATCCTPSFQVTENGGAGWTSVQIPDYDFARSVGAAADGSFRVLAWTSGFEEPREARLFRIAGGSVEPLGAAIDTETTFSNPIAAVSDDGVTWVPYVDGEANHRLAVIGADGSSSVLTPPPGPTPTSAWKAQRTALGMRLLRFTPEGSFSSVFARETFRLEDGSLVPAEAQPVDYIDGELWMGGSGISWDGGAHWSSYRGGSFVPRAPGLGMPRYLSLSGGGIAERFSAILFRRSGLLWPAGVPINFVVDAGPLIAWDATAIHVHEGALPPPPTAIGALEPDTLALLERANLFRADAGLPPLIGDALVSQASRNHSVYTALNAGLPGPEIGHDEITGRPGYTGFDPGVRCEAVGTHCNGEIMHHPAEVDPVADWLATPFHRPLLASPAGGIVGGGKVDGGSAVMDSQGQEQGVLMRPFGYPVGRWRGSDGFGGERPDPVKNCQGSGRPIEYPVGIAVTLFIPADFSLDDARVNQIEVRARGTTGVLPGCFLEDSDFYGLGTMGIFLLDDPLVPGTTYDVRGDWETPSALGPLEARIPGTKTTLSHEWSFTFQPDGYGLGRQARRCRPVRLRRLAATTRQRRGSRRGAKKGLRLQLGFSHPAKARLRRAVLVVPGKERRRHRTRLPLGRVGKREVRVGRRSVLTLRLPRRLARRVPAGEKVKLRLAFRAQRRAGCTLRTTFWRRFGARVGWVNQKRLVTWRTSKPGENRR